MMLTVTPNAAQLLCYVILHPLLAPSSNNWKYVAN